MKNANFIDLLPASLKENKDIIKFSSIIDNYLSNIDNIIDKLTIYARLDDGTLEEEYVDALAKTFHLLANESYRFAGTTEQKRELVRNALILHKTKGTKYAVERVCNILDMKEAKLTEWFEDGGEPYTFKINANGKDYVINRKKGISNGSTIKSGLDTSLLPVVKVGEEIGLFLSGSANANSNSVDSGVNTSMQQKGQMQNVVEGLNASSGNRICKADAPKLPDKSSIKINSGNFNSKVTSIVFNDAYKGTITVSYNDQDMNKIIEQERARGGCSGNGIGNGKCPFPPTFEFTFKYLVVPNNFQVTLKNNANQSYTTSAISGAIFKNLCQKANVPYQTFANRSDMRGGSTLGNISNRQVSLHSVDIGIAQLAMHSSYECAGVKDSDYMLEAITLYYNSDIVINGSDEFAIK